MGTTLTTGLGIINDTLASRKKHRGHRPRTTESLTLTTNASSNRAPTSTALSQVRPAATQNERSMPQSIIVLHGNTMYPFQYEEYGLKDYCQDKGLEQVQFHPATSMEQVLEHLESSTASKPPLIVVRGSISLKHSSGPFGAKPYWGHILDSLKQHYDNKSVPEKDRARVVFMNDDNLLAEYSSTRKIYPQTLAPISMRGLDIFSTRTGDYPYIEAALRSYRASF